MNCIKLFVKMVIHNLLTALLNRMRKGNHTFADVKEIKTFPNTDTTD